MCVPPCSVHFITQQDAACSMQHGDLQHATFAMQNCSKVQDSDLQHCGIAISQRALGTCGMRCYTIAISQHCVHVACRNLRCEGSGRTLCRLLRQHAVGCTLQRALGNMRDHDATLHHCNIATSRAARCAARACRTQCRPLRRVLLPVASARCRLYVALQHRCMASKMPVRMLRLAGAGGLVCPPQH